MSNRNVPFTSTVEELDNLLFKVVVASFNAMYPNDGRMALKAAMHMADKLAAEMEGVAAKQAKSAQARAAAQARYSAPATAQATQAPPTPEIAPNGPEPGAFVQTAPVSTPIKRVRRTKAQIAADEAAKAAAILGTATSAPQPVPMGQVFSPPFQPPIPQAAPQPVQAPAPEAPVVTDFAALAQQAVAQGVPQFAPSAQGVPTFVPTPPPTFG